jgi:predicted permease
MGVAPLLGRTFIPEEDQPGAQLVVVLSYGLWQTSFGGRHDIIGESIRVHGMTVPVVGIMPPSFEFPDNEVEAWVPLQIDPSSSYSRANHYLRVVGRLKPDFTVEDARAELEAYGGRVVEEYPQNYKTFQFGVTGVGLHEAVVGDSRTPLLVLLGAVAFVLLIACANVANLLLARAEGRSRDIAIRSALGASRGQITFQLLTESLVLSVAGGLVGLLLAYLGSRTLLIMAADVIPRLDEVGIDASVLGFTTAVSLLSGLLAGFFPAYRFSMSHIQEKLQKASRSASSSVERLRVRRMLVTVEVALAVVLVIGAGVMIRTLGELTKVDVGFRTDNILTMFMSLPEAGYETPVSVKGFYRDLLGRTEALPGVRSVGIASRVPLASGFGRWSIQIGGEVVETIGEAPVTHFQRVSPSYFGTLGFTLKSGRLLSVTDVAGQPLVGIVNETFVRRLLPGKTAIGHRVRMFDPDSPWMEIVGVVGDIRHEGLQEEPYPMLYVSFAQCEENGVSVPRDMAFFIHAEPDVAMVAEPVRDLIRQMDPSVPVSYIQTMDEVRMSAASDREFPTVLLSIFGSVALFLSAIGIYAMVSYTVSQRTREVGVRMALGADSRGVRWMVVRQAGRSVAAGLALGLLGALHLTDYLESLLFNVSSTDPITYSGVAAVLAAVALFAAYLPARRASRVDPMSVLRTE